MLEHTTLLITGNPLQACRAGMQAAGGGRVVNIGTNLFQNPVVPYHDYTAAKGALLALTRTAAKEWGPQGIRVNMVSGGLLLSPLARGITGQNLVLDGGLVMN
jgi:3-oxoacyl-[acyl-carrier protein] reductase